VSDEREGSYAESREEQSKFEGLVREEGDWQEAVEDLEDGEEPGAESRLPPPVPRSSHALDAALTRRVMDSDSRTAEFRIQLPKSAP